MAVLSRFKHS